MEQNESRMMITLPMLWEVFKKRFLIVILAGILAGVAAFAYSYVTYTPTYTSKARVYVLNEYYSAEGSESAAKDYNNFLLSQSIISDCAAILVTDSVMEEIQTALALDKQTIRDVKVETKISEEERSAIIDIVVTSHDPALSKQMADAVCTYGSQKVKSVVEMNVNLIDAAKIPETPSNSRIDILTPVAAVVAAAAVYLVYLLLHLFDDKIEDAEEVQELLGISLLGDIPNSNEEGQKRRKYGYYASRYAAYYQQDEDSGEQKKTDTASQVKQ